MNRLWTGRQTKGAHDDRVIPPDSPWGQQRSDETLLTGDALAKAGSDATVVRIETDADGHAAYEAHMVKSDGTPITVYVDKSYTVVGVESR